MAFVGSQYARTRPINGPKDRGRKRERESERARERARERERERERERLKGSNSYVGGEEKEKLMSITQSAEGSIGACLPATKKKLFFSPFPSGLFPFH